MEYFSIVIGGFDKDGLINGGLIKVGYLVQLAMVLRFHFVWYVDFSLWFLFDFYQQMLLLYLNYILVFIGKNLD